MLVTLPRLVQVALLLQWRAFPIPKTQNWFRGSRQVGTHFRVRVQLRCTELLKFTGTSEHGHESLSEDGEPLRVILSVVSGGKTSPKQRIKKTVAPEPEPRGTRRRSQAKTQHTL